MLIALDIESIDLFADGAAFGEVGAYERVIAKARGEIDPRHPGNAPIALLDKAPLNVNARVEYTADVFILRPKDPARGNGRILYEVNNRGRKMLFGFLADGPQAMMDDPGTIADIGNGFPLNRGYTIVWSGWDPGVAPGDMRLTFTAPIATNNGKPITQILREEFISGTRGGNLEAFTLSHEAAGLDQPHAQLSLREYTEAPRQPMPRGAWTFVNSRTIKLANGAKPKPGWLYEFHYEAKDPRVQGLGFAATRDIVSWLRYHPAASAATGGKITHALAIGISQSGRYLRHHISEGFNRDEAGRRVFDGVHAHIAGIGRLFFNTPFGQPGRTSTQHEDHESPENWFPFSAARMKDPLTGLEGSLFPEGDTNPRLIETNNATEYWQKGASLLHTDPLGQTDMALPENVRAYMIAGTQHGGRAGALSDHGPNVNLRNPHNPMPAVRALFVALDEWVVSGTPPPESRVPRIADGTLVPADAIGFPVIPGVGVARRANQIATPYDREKLDWDGRSYRALVSKVDTDGNEVAGIRLPDIAVPRATYTGWNLYRSPYPANILADRDGSCIPFAADKAARQATGDPRPSIAERYSSSADYVAKVEVVVNALLKDRLLLPEDATRYLERAREFRGHYT